MIVVVAQLVKFRWADWRVCLRNPRTDLCHTDLCPSAVGFCAASAKRQWNRRDVSWSRDKGL